MILRLSFLFFFLLTPMVLAQTDSGFNLNDPSEKVKSKCTEEGPFSIYKDNYMLLGFSNSSLNDELTFKFQLSAKFQLPIPGIYLAYTQRSFMDVLQDSMPFTDHNFEPEAYYTYSFPETISKKYWLKSVLAGYRHSSNGLGGTPSRSWDRFYVEAEFKSRGFYIRPTLWIPFFKEAADYVIEKYWGYGELLAGYVWDNDIRISGLFRLGTDLPNGNVKVDVTIPFSLLFENLAKGWKQSNLWVQAFHGHGETFLGINENSTAIAVGFGFRPDFKK